MEKLTKPQRESIQKMSTPRLTHKLLEAGADEQAVEGMDRPAMLQAWAEMVAAGKDKPPKAEVGTLPTGYDPDLERRRLEFEIRKYEGEREERSCRREKEAAEREEERAIKLRKLALREKEVKAQLERDREKKSLVDQAKRFGLALKGTIARMPTDPVDMLSYFRDIERQFEKFEVPGDLRVELLRPHLNDKAKVLVSQMDPAKNTDYDAVKTMLLKEFKLLPDLYPDKFNT